MADLIFVLRSLDISGLHDFFFCYAFSYFLPGSREVVSADFSENERNKTGTLQPEILSEFAFGEISFSDHVPFGPGRLGF